MHVVRQEERQKAEQRVIKGHRPSSDHDHVHCSCLNQLDKLSDEIHSPSMNNFKIKAFSDMTLLCEVW